LLSNISLLLPKFQGMISLIQTDNISKRFGDRLLFEQISFTINEGEKVALVAKNGTGKTTLFNLLASIDTPTEGKITYKRELKMAYLSQEPSFSQDSSVITEMFSEENELNNVVKHYEKMLLNDDGDALAVAAERMDSLKAWDHEAKAKRLLSILKLDNFTQSIKTLSGGQKKRLALAKVLFEEPELLLLDEPTNHLDLEMIEWLEEYLQATKITLFMVTHDRYFLDRICNKIIELDNNTLFTYNGNFTYYLEKRQARLEQQQATTSKAQNLMRTEIEWVRRMPKARGTKAKYRMDAFKELKAKATKRIEDKNVAIQVKAGRIGNKIVNATDISKSYDDLKLFTNFSYKFARFEKVGIIGDNGTGKSTLLNVLTNNLLPDTGSIDIGETVKFGFYKQEGLQFDENTKVIDVVREIAETVKMGDGNTVSVAQFLNHFLFPPETHYNYVYKLSGGEKRRLYLVTVLMREPNFLVLDEPTNDLDIQTLTVLEDYLLNFSGNVLVVTHDRYFMDKIVDHVFAFEGNGKVRDFPGNYSQYREQKQQQKSVDSDSSNTNKELKNSKKNQNSGIKLTYKEKIELRELEENIEKLESEKKTLEDSLSEGNLSENELIDTSENIGKIMEKLDEITLRWMELSEKE
jgi:ATP-binding cassette subfamily F protein uup